MPLIKGKSDKAFSKNVSTEMHHDHPLKQSLAIAYAMKRKAQKKAQGGDMCAEGCEIEHEHKGDMANPMGLLKREAEDYHRDGYADGGYAEGDEVEDSSDDSDDSETKRPVVDPDKAKEFMKGFMGFAEGGDVDGNLVDSIMHKRGSSKGAGANYTPPISEFEDNQFDDMVKDDNMSGREYTGANSGDEIGDEGEDERRHDIVAQIMRSRAKKDRLPNPR